MSCEFFVKNIGIKMPNSDLIMQCYEKFGYKYLTLFFIDGKNIFVDKEQDCIFDFIEDLYQDVTEKDGFVIVFHNENQMNFLDVNQEKLFYRTKDNISISKNDCDCLDEVLLINKEKYKPFFQMFLQDNSYVEISINSINVYGKTITKDDYICSTEFQTINENIVLFKNTINNVFDFSKCCYICGKENFDHGYCINHVMYVCNTCYLNMNCCQCKDCGSHFSQKYMVNSSKCLECQLKTTFKLSDLFLDNSVGMKYLECLSNPYVKLNDIEFSREKTEKLLNNKLFFELVELRKQADEFVKKVDSDVYGREKLKLLMNLHKPFLVGY